jgi:hypothetical protein
MKILLIVVAVGFCVSILVLFNKNASQADELVTIRRELQEADDKGSNRIRQLEDDAKANQERQAALTEDLREQKTQLAAVRALGDQHQATLTSLKADVANGVQSELTKEVIKTAAPLLLKNMREDKTLIKDPAFLEAIAKTLVTNFREDLRGAAGADADNAVVVKMLAADPDFLNRVSVSALIQTDKQPPVDRK